MSGTPSLSHDLLLLMLALARMRDRDQIVRLFIEALEAAVPGVSLRRVEPGEASDGEVVELATPDARFGHIAVVDRAGALDPEGRAVFRNAILMLAVVLENVSRAERLADENARLDAAVAERTAQLRHLAADLERRVAERTSQLELANQELEAFAYSVSHDLRAPLRHVSGFVDFLEQRTAAAGDEKARYYVGAIRRAARNMTALIDDLLSFSRAARAELARRPVDLAVVVRELVAELEPEAAGREVEWRLGPLPVVWADRPLLKLALANLLSNALKYTRTHPRAVIEVGCEPGPGGAAAPPEREAVIFVRDDGVGFDPAYRDRLFRVFQRLHRAEEFEGTGVGLANVRRIVARHGGRTWADGAPGQGATFYLSLPLPPGPVAGEQPCPGRGS